jgi:hypothetical protein
LRCLCLLESFVSIRGQPDHFEPWVPVESGLEQDTKVVDVVDKQYTDSDKTLPFSPLSLGFRPPEHKSSSA